MIAINKQLSYLEVDLTVCHINRCQIYLLTIIKVYVVSDLKYCRNVESSSRCHQLTFNK